MAKINNSFSAIILAGGIGKRMKSETPKVLHKIGNIPMIARTVNTLRELSPAQIITVVNPQNEKSLRQLLKTEFALQQSPLGTGNAAKTGLAKVSENIETVAFLYGDDTAFYSSATISKIHKRHQKNASTVTFVTVIKNNPAGLGRIIRNGPKAIAIVEEKDATPNQKKIKEVNDGLYFFKKNWVIDNLSKLTPSSTTGEIYLTGLIDIAFKTKEKVETFTLRDDRQWHGVNTQQELKEANKKLGKSVHIMGIGGSGASALAGIAQGCGYNVTGCDTNPTSAYLDKKNFNVSYGHSSSHLLSIGTLIVSPSVLKLDPNNPEIKEAKEHKIPIYTWQEFQGKILQKGKFTIAIAGAYGKSTTTSMISQILIDQNKDPTCEIGAKILEWGANFRVGKSKYYVCEADEYNNNFLNYKPDIAVVLNTDWDHPDFFKTEQEVQESFTNFINKITKNGILITTDMIQRKLSKFIRKDIKIVKVIEFSDLSLSLIGEFRKQNANAALTVAKVLNLDLEEAKNSVQNFKGTKRRLEFKGKINGVTFYDDYAVQPRTIKATTDALKAKFSTQKLLLVLEPHMSSRVEKFFDKFIHALKRSKADIVWITDVYAAREKSIGINLGSKLAKAIGSKATFTGSVDNTADKIKDNLNEFGVVCSMGAGDSYKIYDLVKNG